MKPPREVLVVKLYCCKTTKVCTIQDIGEGELTEFIEHSVFLELQKELAEEKTQKQRWYDNTQKLLDTKESLCADVKALEEQCEKLAEALEFECGNRCAHQNPCNAREALSAYRDWKEIK